jgi:hypothetical protein
MTKFVKMFYKESIVSHLKKSQQIICRVDYDLQTTERARITNNTIHYYNSSYTYTLIAMSKTKQEK